MPDRILRDLNKNAVASLEDILNALGVIRANAEVLPVHFTGIQNRVTSATDVDECGFHGGKNVLDLAEVHVADQRV